MYNDICMDNDRKKIDCPLLKTRVKKKPQPSDVINSDGQINVCIDTL